MNIPNVNIPNVTHYIHAYKIAPWRIQRQWIGSALLAVVALAMVAALYLIVTSRAAIAGREIQDLNFSITASRQVSGDLQTQLASLTTASAMERRALELGFRPVKPDEVEYLVVAGYSEPEPFFLSTTQNLQLSALTIAPEYNQSLLDWMDDRLLSSRGLQ